MECAKCKNPVSRNPVLGVPPYCKDCQSRLGSFKTKIPEFAGQKIKDARGMYSNDIVPHHYKGHLNKEWLESRYGGAERAKKEGYTDREIKEAKYVYSGSDSYYRKY